MPSAATPRWKFSAMRHEHHPGNTASDLAFRQEYTPAGPSCGPTVKDFLTVELVSVPYKFPLPSQAAVGATGKDSLPVQISHAHVQFAQYEEQRRQLEASQPVSDFDRTVEQIKKLAAPKPKRVRKRKNPADGKELGDGE